MTTRTTIVGAAVVAAFVAAVVAHPATAETPRASAVLPAQKPKPKPRPKPKAPPPKRTALKEELHDIALAFDRAHNQISTHAVHLKGKIGSRDGKWPAALDACLDWVNQPEADTPEEAAARERAREAYAKEMAGVAASVEVQLIATHVHPMGKAIDGLDRHLARLRLIASLRKGDPLLSARASLLLQLYRVLDKAVSAYADAAVGERGKWEALETISCLAAVGQHKDRPENLRAATRILTVATGILRAILAGLK